LSFPCHAAIYEHANVGDMAQIRRVVESEAGEILALGNENCIKAAGRDLSDDEWIDGFCSCGTITVGR